MTTELLCQHKMAGFECEFVEQPPSVIQTECPVCLLVLREPHQAICCGKSFCKVCYEKAEETESGCPTCKEEDEFYCYPNKGLQMPLYDLKVYCPHKSKGCEWTGELRELDNHLNSDPPADKSLEGCPFEDVKCPLSYAGCEEKLPRQQLDDHLSERTVGHMLMQAKKHCNETRSLNTEMQRVVAQKRLLELRVAELKGKMEELQREVKDLKDAQQVATCTGQPIGQVEFTMTNFEQHKADNNRWWSSHFYTHPQGYKMCLSVEANGIGNAKGIHTSVFIHMMRGEFDEQLKWPYDGKITVMVVDQVENRRHYTRVIPFDDQTPEVQRKRVTEGSMNTAGYGFFNFLPHANLEPFYLKNDCLKFRILGIEFNKSVSKPSTSKHQS